TMRPKHSLNHNIKSVPLVLTGNNRQGRICDIGCGEKRGEINAFEISIAVAEAATRQWFRLCGRLGKERNFGDHHPHAEDRACIMS
ncbi:hypothetical protein ACFSAG_10570, partial [Sphingorhabdus buctiana]